LPPKDGQFQNKTFHFVSEDHLRVKVGAETNNKCDKQEDKINFIKWINDVGILYNSPRKQ